MSKAGHPYSSRWEKRLLAVHGASETDEFIDAVFKLLAITVKSDFQLVCMRNIDGVPMIARDSRGRYFDPTYMEGFFRHNPTVKHVLIRPGLKILVSRDSLPRDDLLRRSKFYTHYMQPENWRHSIALFFWSGFPPLPRNVFCVFRAENQPDFSDEDAARLRHLHPHISTAIKRLHRQFRDRNSRDGFNAMLQRLPIASLLLDFDFRVIHETGSAREFTENWLGARLKRSRNPSIPTEILETCKVLNQEWQSQIRQGFKDATPIAGKCLNPVNPSVEAEITLVFRQESALAYPCFLIQYHDRSAPSRTESANRIDHLIKLTEAEREAVLLAADGHDNQQIADRIGRSVPAVKLRLHTAFRKLGVQNRVQLANLFRR